MSDASGGGASRSTDPAAGTSAATDVSLREYLTALIDAVERRSDLQFEAMKKAVEKAEVANEQRLSGFPQLFADSAELKALADKLQEGIDRNREDLDRLAERLDLATGETSGARLTKTALYTSMGAAVAVIGMLVVLANYLTT